METIEIMQLERSCERIISLMEEVVEGISKTGDYFEVMTEKVDKFSSALEQVQSKMDINKVESFFQIFGDSLNYLDSAVSLMTNVFGLASTLVNGLGSALTWLAANPVVAVIGAIGLAISAFALFKSSQEETKYEVEDCSESVQKQIEDINNLTGAMDNVKNQAEERSISLEAEFKTLEHNLDLLEAMGGESGYVDNLATAQALIDQINGKIPDSVRLTEDGKIEWLKNREAIDENIESLKEKARVEAYSQLYTESLKAQIAAEREHGQAVQELTEKRKRQMELEAEQNRLREIMQSHSKDLSWFQSEEAMRYQEQLNNINKELEPLNADIQYLKEGVETSGQAWEEATESVNIYGEAMTSNQDIIGESSSVIGKSTEEQKVKLAELADEYNKSKQVVEDYANKSIEMDEATAIQAQISKDFIIAKYAEQAIAQNLSFEEMSHALMEHGIALDEEEKRQLETSMTNLSEGMTMQEMQFQLSKQRTLDVLKEHNANMSLEEQTQYGLLLEQLNGFGIAVDATKAEQYTRMLELANQHNIDLSTVQGEQYTQFLALLSEHGIAVDSTLGQQYLSLFLKASTAGDEEGRVFIDNMKNGIISNSITGETQQIWQEGQNVLGKPLSTDIELESASSFGRRIDGIIPDNTVIPTTMKVTGKVDSGLASFFADIGYNISSFFSGFFADGGFPPLGQMFIAREAGPELVGTIGGRTAVANNNQILDGIYFAVKDALSFQQNSGDLYLTIQNEDGSKIEKIIRNYNRFMSRTGGKGGFVV